MCGVSMETVYFVSGAQPLTPEFDFDAVMKALAMMMNCPVVSSLALLPRYLRAPFLHAHALPVPFSRPWTLRITTESGYCRRSVHCSKREIPERMRLTSHKPPNTQVFPEWIQWAILTGVVSTVLGFIFMIIKYFGYVRRREEFIHHYLRVSDLQKDESRHTIVKKKPTELEKELLRVANKISNEFVTAQEMGLKARTLDDYRTIIQIQSSLLDGIVARKETAREVNREKMSALATLVCNLRLLTTNLHRRLQTGEQDGAASNLQCLLAELAANDKQYKVRQPPNPRKSAITS